MNITKNVEKAFTKYEDSEVGINLNGVPILLKDMPVSLSIIDFAVGYQFAMNNILQCLSWEFGHCDAAIIGRVVKKLEELK